MPTICLSRFSWQKQSRATNQFTLAQSETRTKYSNRMQNICWLSHTCTIAKCRHSWNVCSVAVHIATPKPSTARSVRCATLAMTIIASGWLSVSMPPIIIILFALLLFFGYSLFSCSRLLPSNYMKLNFNRIYWLAWVLFHCKYCSHLFFVRIYLGIILLLCARQSLLSSIF